MRNSINIAFLGDISLNDTYVDKYKRGHKPFENVSPLLKKCDFVIGNLECIAKGNLGENLKKQPRLSTDVETLNFLKDIHLNVACLAHNHVYDHLEDGFKQTTKFLFDNKIKYLGAGFTPYESAKELILEKNGIKLALLNYVTSDTNPNIPEDAELQPNWFDIVKVITKINEIKGSVDHVILLLHWGGKTEGHLLPDPELHHIAFNLIKNGADLIIGSHSHTSQAIQIINGRYAFFSLGNFCFADIESGGDLVYQERGRRSKGLMPIIQFDKNEIVIESLYRIKNKNLTLFPKLINKNSKPWLFEICRKNRLIHKIIKAYERFYKYYSILFVDGLNNRKPKIKIAKQILSKYV